MTEVREAQGQAYGGVDVHGLPPARSQYDLDCTAAAAYLGIKKGTLDLWRSQRRNVIPFAKVGRRISNAQRKRKT